MSECELCPKCGREAHRDEVDVGIGILYGPYGCYCGWSEDERYDRSEGSSPAQLEHPDHYVDSCGGLTPHEGIRDRLYSLGLNGDNVIEEVFRRSDA